jgi:uncharacterized protein YggU (UPF0235/DUF167 family)
MQGGIRFFVYLTPGAKNEAMTAIVNTEDRGFAIKISVQERPIDNKANRSMIEFIASSFRVSKTSVIVEHGARSRLKQIFVSGCSIENIPVDALRILNDLLVKSTT